ncbi:glutathione-S-transferase theta, GST [Pestalotiopsis sp. NC0098]|nr:glutathione-S-transferase theta, GST [Pestalotiopsis sp. NC0098]
MPPPDADLHPVATGLARETIDKHQSEQPLKLYSGWFCPFVQRVWLALEEKGIPYQYVEVNPYHKPESLMRSNPRGLVPTLEVAPGKALYESNVLLEYLEDAYPDHRPLRPADPFARARSRIWSDFVTSRVIPAFHRLLQFQATGGNEGEAKLDALRAEYRAKLLEFARAMVPKDDGPYFAGAELTTVDIVMAPWAVRSWVFDRFKGGLRIPEPGKGGDDEEAWARWRTWLDAVGSLESVRRTTSEEQYYMPIYKRYADDIAQSELAKATREGRGVP